MARLSIAVALAMLVSACASAPPVAPPKPTEPPGFDQKMSWILRLEDARILRDPAPPPAPAPPPPPAPVRGQRPAPVVVAPPPPPPPDLLKLLTDGEGRIRRRAALAVGRVGLKEGVPALVTLMADPDPEIRQMAAFALGLIGDPGARDPLITALGDPSPLMKGSAAEALGLLGDTAAAQPIAQMAAGIVASGGLAQVPADAVDSTRDAPAAAFRLAIYALVRLKAFDALASVVLDPTGQPRVKWWPVAFALQRLEDKRALPALLILVKEPQPYTRAFAAKGLGAMQDPSAATVLLPLVTGPDASVAVEAIRSLGRLKASAASPVLLKILQTPATSPTMRFEALTALGQIGSAGVTDTCIDLLGDPYPPIRVAAVKSLAALDPFGFMTVLSGLDADTHWSVRAALASALSTLAPEAGLPRLRAMLADQDPKVVAAVLPAIAKLRPPDAAAIMMERLKAGDPIVRAAAATAIGELKPQGGAAALADAYRRGDSDDLFTARTSALAALAAYGAADATPILTAALGDKEWAVRVRAAALLKQLDPASDVSARIRPAPSRNPALYAAPRLTNPTVSTQAFIETDRGTIQLELAVLDAPQTVENFVTLARAGFFDGLPIHRVVSDFVVQAGDPRGDSEGGPGYAIRDELNERAYLRGVVGMALDWADTGGSQFFITHAPEPHLDAKYTVFARVIDGMDVVDKLQMWDVIRQVRIWDGTVVGAPRD